MTAQFFGRQWLFSKVSKILWARQTGHECKAGLLLVGDAGSGKTAFCQHLMSNDCTDPIAIRLSAKNVAALHVVRQHASDTYDAIIELVDHISMQLHNRWPDMRVKSPSSDSIEHDKQSIMRYIEQSIIEPLEQHLLDEPVLILIDGVQSQLCHLAIEYLCTKLPPCATVLITSRNNHLADHLIVFALDDLTNSLVVHDLQEYILFRLDNNAALRSQLDIDTVDIVSHLHVAANGCIYYIELILDVAECGSMPLGQLPINLPHGMHALYLFLAQRLFTSNWTQIKFVLEILLACSPLTQSALLGIIRLHNIEMTSFNDVIGVIAPFVKQRHNVLQLNLDFAAWLQSTQHNFHCDAHNGHLAIIHHLIANRTLTTDAALDRHLQSVRMTELQPILDIYDVELSKQVDDFVEHHRDSTTTPAIDLAASVEANDLEAVIENLKISSTNDIDRMDKNGDTSLIIAARCGYDNIVQMLCKAGANVERCGGDGWSPLRSAAFAGHINVVRVLIEHGADVNACGEDGGRILKSAAWSGHAQVLNELINAGARVDDSDNDACTSLMTSVHMKHLKCVRTLLNHKCNVNSVDKTGRHALMFCVSDEQRHIAQALLKNQADVNLQDRFGRTALLHAAMNGAYELCQLLVENVADIDLPDQSGCTPLQAAAAYGYERLVDALIVWGADVNWVDVNGRSALTIAAAHAQAGVVASLLAHGMDEWHADNDGTLPIHHAATAVNAHVTLTRLVSHSPSCVNAPDKHDGRRPIFMAVCEGMIDNVRTLISLGAHIDVTTLLGDTAIRQALLNEDAECLNVLLDAGAAINQCDVDGHTILESCLLERRTALLDRLLSSIDTPDLLLNTIDRHGRSPLHLAATIADVDAIASLVRHGVNVDLQDADGNTALMTAIWSKEPSATNCTALLLNSGANTEATNKSAHATALHVAAQGIPTERDCLERIKLLLKHGANPDVVDKNGLRPNDVATACGMKEINELLLYNKTYSTRRSHDKNSSGYNSQTPSTSWSQGSTHSLSPPSSSEKLAKNPRNASFRQRIITNPKYRIRVNQKSQ